MDKPAPLSLPPPSSCTCTGCQSACTRKPGWFAPGEVELVAAARGVSVPELFRAYLAVDWWEGDEPTFVLSPAIIRHGSVHAGTEIPANPLGRCVFYEGGRCSIHAVKPRECATYHHDMTREQVAASHRGVFEAWQSPAHQAQIVELLGREPVAASYDVLDSFMW
jgi:Fe-S-cluster containining protein